MTELAPQDDEGSYNRPKYDFSAGLSESLPMVSTPQRNSAMCLSVVLQDFSTCGRRSREGITSMWGTPAPGATGSSWLWCSGACCSTSPSRLHRTTQRGLPGAAGSLTRLSLFLEHQT